MESRLTAWGGGWGGEIVQNRKRTQGHSQQCGNCVREGNGIGGRGNKGINGKGKNTIKINY